MTDNFRCACLLLPSVMGVLNNIIEFPSDAFKIVTHFRHPIPTRSDTIGPWLDGLSLLAWVSALTNAALVYLFHPTAASAVGLRAPLSSSTVGTTVGGPHHEQRPTQMRDAVVRALFIALAASHGYIILRAAVRHVLERVLWIGSAEKARLDEATREVKERYFQTMQPATEEHVSLSVPPPEDPFWSFDEGIDEIRKGIKEV
jgi:anoctamin-10